MNKNNSNGKIKCDSEFSEENISYDQHFFQPQNHNSFYLESKKFKNNVSNDSNNLNFFYDKQKFNSTKPSSQNNVANNDPCRYEIERELALKGNYSSITNENMDYGINNGNFQHNNMVPYFKSNSYGDDNIEQEHLNDIKKRKLDLFTGSTNDVAYKKKQEMEPLFEPQKDLNWVNGAPNVTNLIKERFIPGKEKRNELPTQQIRQTPGINLGYYENNDQGYNNSFRVLPKTVDELRRADNPKITYTADIIQGKKGDKRTILPNVKKYKPILIKEQDENDFIQSMGYIKAPKVEDNFNINPNNRQDTNIEWYGPAESNINVNKPKSMQEIFKESVKLNYNNDCPRNLLAIDQQKNITATSKNYHIDNNMRMQTQDNKYIPNLQQINQSYINNLKNLEPTMRNLYEINNNINNINEATKGGYIYNKDYRPDPTLREIHEKNHNLNNFNGMEKSYAINYDDKPDFNLKNIIEDPHGKNISNINPIDKKSYTIDYNDVPEINLKNVLENNEFIGNINDARGNKMTAFDYNQKLDNNLRNIIEINENINNINPVNKKSYVFDGEIDITKKQILEDSLISPNIQNQNKKGYIYNENYNPSVNKKEIYQEAGEIFIRNMNDVNKSYTKNNEPIQATKKQLLIDGKNNMNLNGITKKNYSIDYKDKPFINKKTINQENILSPNIQVNNKNGQVQSYQKMGTTLKELVINNNIINNIQGNQKNRAFNYKMKIQNNLRNIIQDAKGKNINNIKLGNNGRVVNYKDVPNKTLKEILEINNTVGNIKRYPTGKNYIIDYKNKPNITKRQIIEKNERLSNINPNGNEIGGYQNEVKNIKVLKTLKEMNENNNYIGQVVPNEEEIGGYIVENTNINMPITKKQLLTNQKYTTPILNMNKKTRNRHDFTNANVNELKERIIINKQKIKPVDIGLNNGPTMNFTAINMREDNDASHNRDLMKTRIIKTDGQIKNVHTQEKNREQIDYINREYIAETLENNELINNIVHKSFTLV